MAVGAIINKLLPDDLFYKRSSCVFVDASKVAFLLDFVHMFWNMLCGSGEWRKSMMIGAISLIRKQ